jgi:hypothetical protein
LNKKLITLFACLTLTILIFNGIASANELIITVDGKTVNYNYGKPLIDSGRTLVPLRDLLIALGVPNDDKHIIWKKENSSVLVLFHGRSLRITVGNNTYEINGDEQMDKIEVPAKNVNGAVYLPVRVVAEALGYGVLFDSSSNTVIIKSAPDNKPKLDKGDLKTYEGNWIYSGEQHGDLYNLNISEVQGNTAKIDFSNPFSMGDEDHMEGDVTFDKNGKGIATLNYMIKIDQEPQFEKSPQFIQASIELTENGIIYTDLSANSNLVNSIVKYEYRYNPDEQQFVQELHDKSSQSVQQLNISNFDRDHEFKQTPENRELINALFKNMKWDSSSSTMTINVLELKKGLIIEATDGIKDLGFIEPNQTYTLKVTTNFYLTANYSDYSGEELIIYGTSSNNDLRIFAKDVPGDLGPVLFEKTINSNGVNVYTIDSVIKGIQTK